MDVDTGGIACCFDRASQRIYADYRKRGLGETAVAIAESVGGAGLEGSSVLEIGCGFGALSLELVRRGASAAIGIDLSSKMIQMANRLASDKGLSDHVSFRLGDGATSKLPASAVVILDTVLCCYPDMTALIENSSSAAKNFYAISMPDDNRFATRALMLLLPLQRLIFRRSGFRFFIHRTQEIRGDLESRGFRLASESPAGWIWSVWVFRKV